VLEGHLYQSFREEDDVRYMYVINLLAQVLSGVLVGLKVVGIIQVAALAVLHVLPFRLLSLSFWKQPCFKYLTCCVFMQTTMLFVLLVYRPYKESLKERLSELRKFVDALNAFAMIAYALAVVGVAHVVQLLEYTNAGLMILYACVATWFSISRTCKRLKPHSKFEHSPTKGTYDTGSTFSPESPPRSPSRGKGKGALLNPPPPVLPTNGGRRRRPEPRLPSERDAYADLELIKL
jgi:hypothetical protein